MTRMNIFFVPSRRIQTLPNANLSKSLYDHFAGLPIEERDRPHVVGFAPNKPIKNRGDAKVQEDVAALGDLSSGDTAQRIDAYVPLSEVLPMPLNENDVHVILKGLPVTLTIYVKDNEIFHVVKIPETTELNEISSYIKRDSISAVYTPRDAIAYNVDSEQEIGKAISGLPEADLKKQDLNLTIGEVFPGAVRRRIVHLIVTAVSQEEEPPLKRQRTSHQDVTKRLILQWSQPVAAPNIGMLLSHLEKPLTNDEKIPISQEDFDTVCIPFSTKQPWLALSPDCASELFRISDTETAKEVAGQIIIEVISRTPPDAGTEDAFHMHWDHNILEILRLALPDAQFVRNSSHHTSTALKRPDLGFLLQNRCLFRGEEKGPDSAGDPQAELVEKLVYTYEPLPYVFGYHAIGTNVNLVALAPSTAPFPLFTHNIKYREERIHNLVHLIRLCSVLRWMSNMLTRRPLPEYSTFPRPDGLTHITIGATIEKKFCHPDARARVAHLCHIYSLLREKQVPNVDELHSFCDEKAPFFVITEPVGIDVTPSNGQEVFQMITCVLQALVALHSEPSPIYHRDIRQANIMKRHDQDSWFLIDWLEASTIPTRAAKHLSTAEHSPRVREDNHGAEVDLWGVGNCLKGLASHNKVENPYEVTRIALRWKEILTTSASSALEEIQTACHLFFK